MQSKTIPFTEELRAQLLTLVAESAHGVLLDSFAAAQTVVPVTGIGYELVAAYGTTATCSGDAAAFATLQKFFSDQKGQWIFGHAGYDLKNAFEKLDDRHRNQTGFADYTFFVPAVVATVKNNVLTLYAADCDAEIARLQTAATFNSAAANNTRLQPKLSREQYLDAIAIVKKHILRGDIYEMNFCHELFATSAQIVPVSVFQQLSKIAPNPFSCFYHVNESYLLCASPERYIRKSGKQLLSQPIKGTAARGTDSAMDKALYDGLVNSEKDKSENVMIVDLVRNDLSRISNGPTVKVTELFGVYTYPGAHQMVSSIECVVDPSITFDKVLQHTFPMGSMTGAPKVRAMQIIDELEESRRGLFSGTVGYITPDGDFDFNVVIRSIQFNAKTGYLSLMAGGAITANSDAEKEYEETMVKLKPQLQALGCYQPEMKVKHA